MSPTPVPAKDDLVDKVATLLAADPRVDEPAGLAALAPLYYGDVAEDDLVERGEQYLAAALRSHWQLALDRTPGTAAVRVYTPNPSEHGWESTHTVVEVVTDDMPFIVDSVTMELARHELGIHLVVHPVLHTRRTAEGHLLGLAEPSSDDEDAVGGEASESFVHVEIDRETDTAVLDQVRDDLVRVLGDVRAATSDWLKMLARLRRVVDTLSTNRPPVPEAELDEARAFLAWIADHRFTFLGFREYELDVVDGEDVVRAAPGTGLGILRDRDGKPGGFDRLSPEGRARAREKTVLVLTKANSRSTVHRSGYLDYVGVKKFDDHGEVIGEWRFLGLYTSTAYSSSPIDIPLLRRKVVEVVERAGFQRASHSEKDLIAILETYPRDDLFQISVEELFEISMAILQLQERRRVRLFARRDSWGRFVSCLVFVPRDRYTTTLRLRVAEILSKAFEATGHEFQARVSESVLARLHYVLHTGPDAPTEVDLRAIESEIAGATRLWTDDLRDSLVRARGEEEGLTLFRKYADAFGASYRDDFSALSAGADIMRLEALVADPAAGPGVRLSRSAEGRGADLDFTIFGAGAPLPLSAVMPILQNMGVSVVDEHPYEVAPAGGPPLWIERFGLLASAGTGPATKEVRDAFQAAFSAVLRGEAEDDSLQRLVLSAGITWREVAILRAYSRYMRQTGTLFSQSYIADALAAQPRIATLLVELFQARFDPGRQSIAAEECARIDEELNRALDEVVSLDEDRILRTLMHLVLATVRTSCYQHRPGPDDHLTFKLDPTRIPGLPAPLPAYEIFVYSPRVEGVHLRAGKVARGGIRWSDRREDFRTEVLGLMKAQTVKNSVIVPVGAKGGFVVKQPPAEREALVAEVISCYRAFISGLLDVTDNLVANEVVPSSGVVRYDGDDPYLVVAADKGTATFSDIANEIAVSRRFWLGDAFASGGSAGYDHKKMGITARGAWESLKRHFRELGIDPNVDDFTAVGIGDMSGDVFGNGMLLSRHIRLVAAFDHRHVFVDPDPDPEASFRERERLFALPRSTWDDYDRARLSAGGGIYSRSAKAITLSAEARRRLAIDTEVLTPGELIRAILAAPVDLLWNGGIGTYVKATDESHADVGDKTNDSIRVDARELRCRAVVEGGNLGLTQRGRVEYALAGGKVNTDAIDNSAGVDCSDHEVNIKILLDGAVAARELTHDERDRLLVEMTGEVANLVLRDNYRQNQALANAVAQALSMEDVHARYLRSLEHEGHLDRRLEALPDDEALTVRRNAGRGLTSPELAVLLAYTKNRLEQELVASDLPSDPDCAAELDRYFPHPILERFRHRVPAHPLAREIVATTLANNVVNHAGISFLFRLGEETGAPTDDIVRAHLVAWEVLVQYDLWRDIAMLDRQLGSETQTFMYLESRKLVERASRWLLRHRRRPLPVKATIEAFAPGVAQLAHALPDLLLGGEREWLESCTADLAAQGVPYELARRVAGLESLFTAFDIVDVAQSTGRDVVEVAGLYTVVGDRLQLDWLRDRVVDLPRGDRWNALARAALRDDAYNEHRDVVADVLRYAEPGTTADVALRTWETRNAGAVERARQVVDDVRTHGVFDLSTLSVALREVRGLTQTEG